jgi:hypothetical protein
MNEKKDLRKISSKKIYVRWDVTPFGLVDDDQYIWRIAVFVLGGG